MKLLSLITFAFFTLIACEAEPTFLPEKSIEGVNTYGYILNADDTVGGNIDSNDIAERLTEDQFRLRFHHTKRISFNSKGLIQKVLEIYIHHNTLENEFSLDSVRSIDFLTNDSNDKIDIDSLFLNPKSDRPLKLNNFKENSLIITRHSASQKYLSGCFEFNMAPFNVSTDTMFLDTSKNVNFAMGRFDVVYTE